MNNSPPSLDAEELLHLAVDASRRDQHEGAIRYLKQALEISSGNAKVHYMLGAEHAQIGLYGRAIEEMHAAVKLDPTLHTARFQLGLLYLTSARVAEAADAWKALDELGADQPLRLFKNGLLALAGDDFAACRTQLEKGIALNKSGDALNRDMQKVLEQLPANGSTPPGKGADADKPGSRPVFLSAYLDGGGKGK